MGSSFRHVRKRNTYTLVREAVAILFIYIVRVMYGVHAVVERRTVSSQMLLRIYASYLRVSSIRVYCSSKCLTCQSPIVDLFFETAVKSGNVPMFV